jgi:uncharacterized protein YdgA (DUF945 family)
VFVHVCVQRYLSLNQTIALCFVGVVVVIDVVAIGCNWLVGCSITNVDQWFVCTWNQNCTVTNKHYSSSINNVRCMYVSE